MNPLPPQAYTKDIMLKAYAWVMNQPSSIKELATTPDILVSLYLKAQRDGLESLERPSIQNFREELKSLAGMMDHLELQPEIRNQVHEAPPPQQAPRPQPSPAMNIQINNVSNINGQSNGPVLNQFDERTLKMIRDVKEALNLSNDVDAMRALVQLGYKALRGIVSD